MRDEILQEAEIHRVMSHMPVNVLKPLTGKAEDNRSPTVQDKVVSLFQAGSGALAFSNSASPLQVGEAVKLATKIGAGASFRIVARKADSMELG